MWCVFTNVLIALRGWEDCYRTGLSLGEFTFGLKDSAHKVSNESCAKQHTYGKVMKISDPHCSP